MARAALLLVVLVAGCGTTSVDAVTPWFRSFHHKESSFDSGGRVKTWVELRRGRGWTKIRDASGGVVLADGNVAFHLSDGVAIVSDHGTPVRVPSCEERLPILSPDRRRVVCIDRNLQSLGFQGETLFAVDEQQVSVTDTNRRRCRLVAVERDGQAVTVASTTATYPPDTCSSLSLWRALDGVKLESARPL